jgi:butyryl-CoA dehydrogenase
MCLSEPQAGSSLSDIVTRAVPDGDDFEADPLGPRYRLAGNKMWISNGEHELTENIVHLVLAKIPGPDGKLVPGTRGISLFIVPRSWSTSAASSPANATTSRWPGSTTSSATAASRTPC